LSILRVKQWHGRGLNAALARFGALLRGTISDNPELFLPVACLFVWQLTAIAAKPTAFGFALLLTLILFIYGYRVLGTTEWLRRLGWVSPRQGFWLYSLIAGFAAAGGVGGLPGSSTSPWDGSLLRNGYSWPVLPDQ
jgi:hypothetical protein